MKAVKVEYTVKEEYVETNKRNIEQVMSELRSLNNDDIKYCSFLLSDGKTFVHFGIYANQESMSIVSNLDSFNTFRQQLQESQPEVPPKAEDLHLVAAAYDIF